MQIFLWMFTNCRFCGIMRSVMEMEIELQKRKRNRLENYDYSSPGAYFVTICTEERKNYFWSDNLNPQIFSWKYVGANCVRPQNLPLSNIGEIVLAELERWNKSYDAVSLYSYVIMPNHLHIMIVISAGEYYGRQNGKAVQRCCYKKSWQIYLAKIIFRPHNTRYAGLRYKIKLHP